MAHGPDRLNREKLMQSHQPWAAPASRGAVFVLGFVLLSTLAMEALAAENAPSASRPSLVVIAPGQFHAALQTFVAHKERTLSVELAALDSILQRSPGGDDPERLKRFLYTAWKERKVRYVLLVGDADVLPVRYMVLDRVTPAAFDYAFYPSDLYYADVAKADGSFDDWNAQREGFHAGYFGEVRGEKNKSDPINFDAIHYKPELALGRWPVSTPEEVQIVADKTIRYEQSLAGATADLRWAAFVMIGGWVDVRGRMDQMARRLPPGWSVEKRYYADEGKPAPTPPPDEANVVALLNAGTRLLLHAGHGRDDQWEGSINTRSLARIRNAETLPVLLSAGCSTARFATLPPYEPYVDVEGNAHAGSDHGEVFTSPPLPPAPYQKGAYNLTGLGEQLLRAGPHGAVAYFGCNTGSQPCGVTLLDGFVDALARQPNARLGDCWAGAVAYYFDHEGLERLKPNDDWYPPSIFFQGMKFMLFGDPTLPMPAAPPHRKAS